jgi:hypothetical protein
LVPLVAFGCAGGQVDPAQSAGSTPSPAATTPTSDPSTATTPQDPTLAARKVDLGQALRTAALKLLGDLPSLADEEAIARAANPRQAYEAQIDKYLADPRFALQVKSYFSDMMKMGGTLTATVGQNQVQVSLDTAPTFAAEIVVNDRPITDLWTATTNTCPTLSADGKTFTDAPCAVANGLKTVGVLTDPGAMAQFYSNMAFRRVRWIQESFACTKFPAEYSASPVAMGNGQFTSPWPFTSVTGGAMAPINFQDTSSVICANCHTTMNHIAPMFANFDPAGVFQTTIQVHTPTPQNPLSKISDWLPSGETYAWRYGNQVTDLTALGAAIAADPAVQKCQVQRAWNWAMNKTDIVNDLAVVPDSTINDVMTVFTQNGLKMKAVFKAIFTAPDFVMF